MPASSSIAPDPEHEDRAVAGEVGGEGKELLDVLLGQHVGAGGHVAHQGDMAGGPQLARRGCAGVGPDLDGPRLGRVAAEVTEALRLARWAWTVDVEVRPTASPISRTDGG